MRQALGKNGFPTTTPIIATSAKSRQGRVDLLSYLRLVFDVDRRKGKGKGKGGGEVASRAGEGGEEQGARGAKESAQAVSSQ